MFVFPNEGPRGICHFQILSGHKINYAYTSVPKTAVLCKIIMEHIKEYLCTILRTITSYLRTNMDFGKIIHVTLN